jgi:putative membrane protein
MPIQNLAGWSFTGLVYMGISRLIWGSDIDPAEVMPTIRFPFVVYVANLVFAMALSLSAGLWPPVILAIAAGVVPAVLALRGDWPRPAPAAESQAWRASPSR